VLLQLKIHIVLYFITVMGKMNFQKPLLQTSVKYILLLSILKTVVLLNIFGKLDTFFEIDFLFIFNTVTFGQFNAFLQDKSINLFNNYYF